MRKLLSALLIACVLAFAPIPVVHAQDGGGLGGSEMKACGDAYEAYRARIASDYDACMVGWALSFGWCQTAYAQGQLAAMGDLLACQLSAMATPAPAQ
jgi:hypothetical protein